MAVWLEIMAPNNSPLHCFQVVQPDPSPVDKTLEGAMQPVLELVKPGPLTLCVCSLAVSRMDKSLADGIYRQPTPMNCIQRWLQDGESGKQH